MSTQRCIWIFIAECLHYNYKMKTIQLLIELRTYFVYIQWNATQHYKWMKCGCMLLHGCYVKESTLNILGWLNGSLKIFYNTLGKNPNETFGPPQYMAYPVTANPWDRHQICSCSCLGMGKHGYRSPQGLRSGASSLPACLPFSQREPGRSTPELEEQTRPPKPLFHTTEPHLICTLKNWA